MLRRSSVAQALQRVRPASLLTFSRSRPAGQDEWLESGPGGAAPPGANTASPLDRWCLGRIGRALSGSPVRLELWDGATAVAAAESAIATVVIKDRGTLLRLLAQPAIEFGEAYTSGRL